ATDEPLDERELRNAREHLRGQDDARPALRRAHEPRTLEPFHELAEQQRMTPGTRGDLFEQPLRRMRDRLEQLAHELLRFLGRQRVDLEAVDDRRRRSPSTALHGLEEALAPEYADPENPGVLGPRGVPDRGEQQLIGVLRVVEED